MGTKTSIVVKGLIKIDKKEYGDSKSKSSVKSGYSKRSEKRSEISNLHYNSNFVCDF